jgi:hypothetical protein
MVVGVRRRRSLRWTGFAPAASAGAAAAPAQIATAPTKPNTAPQRRLRPRQRPNATHRPGLSRRIAADVGSCCRGGVHDFGGQCSGSGVAPLGSGSTRTTAHHRLLPNNFRLPYRQRSSRSGAYVLLPCDIEPCSSGGDDNAAMNRQLSMALLRADDHIMAAFVLTARRVTAPAGLPGRRRGGSSQYCSPHTTGSSFVGLPVEPTKSAITLCHSVFQRDERRL